LGAPVFEFLKRVFGNGLPARDGEERTTRDLPIADLIRRLPFEAFPVAGAKAVEAVQKLHRDQPQATAFIIGHPEDFGLFCEFMERGHSPESSLKAGAALTYESWVAARERESAKSCSLNSMTMRRTNFTGRGQMTSSRHPASSRRLITTASSGRN
jgi:hypothetical protein